MKTLSIHEIAELYIKKVSKVELDSARFAIYRNKRKGNFIAPVALGRRGNNVPTELFAEEDVNKWIEEKRREMRKHVL